MMDVDFWKKTIGDADATHCSDSVAAARVILPRLVGYRKNTTARAEDERVLAAAIVAYARLFYEAAVAP